MLTDVLGTLLAFIAVILLLSVLVTALAQASQAVLGLRGRNLLLGVTRLIEALNGASQPGVAQEAKKDAKKEATRVLNDPKLALIYHVATPTVGVGKAWRVLRGPGVSWVNPDDLASVIAARGRQGTASSVQPTPDPKIRTSAPIQPNLTNSATALQPEASKDAAPVQPDPIRRRITTMEDQISKRFEVQMRAVALVWALVVAVGFQVSAPQLLVDLSNDSVRRDLIIAQSKTLLEQEKQTMAVLKSEAHLPDVIADLVKRFPKYGARFEELSGVGTTKSFVLDELRLVLKDAPDRDDVVKVYSRLLDDAAVKSGRELSAQIGTTRSTLAGFDIRFWKEPNFYWDESTVHYDAILGVLLTMILLSFGAPFWYQMLRDVAALRDRLKPGNADNKLRSKKQDANPG